jgi:5-methylcytosine-specific restriction enzyme A
LSYRWLEAASINAGDFICYNPPQYLASEARIMSRKRFIEGLGGTCVNWYWSWSFVNHDERKIFFGAWDDHIRSNRALIFSEDWEIRRGRLQNAWPQSREHIRLIEEEGYQLHIYPMVCANPEAEIGTGPRKIERIEEEVSPAQLVKKGRDWFAVHQA